ncbi:MAG TPA: hypothetical protein PLO06_08765 [Methanoregulaceae archaeon]|nr:hypothetical protein [Methanoregulaceae archaeon]
MERRSSAAEVDELLHQGSREICNKKGLKITINIEVQEKDGINESTVEETKTALRELGLNDEIALKKDVNYLDGKD